jgi:very-short-patch-repair endonuclease
MHRVSEVAEEKMRELLDTQRDVITSKQALGCGLTARAIDYRLRVGGPWQRLLPGVYLTHRGTVTPDQREVAALLYAGEGSVITGPTAVRRHHLSCAGPDAVDVLISWKVRRQSAGFVRIHRTRAMPATWWTNQTIRYAKVPRSVADAARLLTRFDDVRAVVSAALLHKSCTLEELQAELEHGGLPGSAMLREALAEVGDGIRSVAEAQLRRLIQRSSLPEPMYNARLYDADGEFIAMVDAWWQRAGVAVEVDSRAYHGHADDQDTTVERHDELTARGILALHFKPKRIRADGAKVLTKIARAIAVGEARPPLPISALPAPSLARDPRGSGDTYHRRACSVSPAPPRPAAAAAAAGAG